MARTKIPWATHSINPIRVKGGGWHCTKVSAGCQNCYSETMNMRFGNKKPYDNSPVEFELDLSCFDKLPKTKSAMVFVQSMGDLFHEEMPFEFIDRAMDMINICRQHVFQILTKRPERVLDYINRIGSFRWHSNLWLGVTCENQEMADKRIPILLQIPAAVRFVSLEPLLGEISESSMEFIDTINTCRYCGYFLDGECHCSGHRKSLLDWVIVGAESGSKRRECKTAWIWSIVDQCRDAGVPCFVKQLHIKGKVSKNMAEWPEGLRVQEYPA